MGFNLKQQLVFYGAYHRDPVNIAIHMTCVPVILVSAFLLLTLPNATNTPTLPIRTSTLLTELHLPLNLGTLAATLYSTLYLLLSPNIAGATLAPLVLACASWVNKLHTHYSTNIRSLNLVAVGFHVAAWILQFVGHGKYEGRKPALLDNLAQALFLAPLFVWYEVLFKLGFYRELREEVEGEIEVQVAKMNRKKGGE
ncbi:hypothetical protein BDV96DRAFT_548518 [Lophiotrema nucula]|uniref:DUF962 domain-containing protein n=1 Tax=Lophiotrema nucula TaxID=690887 RepID=A0A6A5Z2A0_9PLEO|nr:hypothetical protein BDV96DRAFT_548518 [Lophiotrema nucula]